MLPVLLGGDANVYGMARSFYECYGVRSLAVCRRALPALTHSRLVRVAVQDPAFGQDHVFTATLLGLAAQYPGVPQNSHLLRRRLHGPAGPPCRRAARGVPLCLPAARGAASGR